VLITIRARPSTSGRGWRPFHLAAMPTSKFKLSALALASLSAVSILAVIASAQGVSSPQATGPQATGPQATGGKIRAVVIGISRYQKLPGGQQLQFAERDAAAFAQSLKAAGARPDDVRLLTGPQATSAAIKSSIGNWLARSATEADTVYIYFSGHGWVESGFGEAYLLGFDSDTADPYATALSISELSGALGRRVRARQVLIVADAIRRDLFDPESNPSASATFIQAINQLTASRPGASALLAASPGEFSREGQRWDGHGVFTKHLLDAMSGGDRDGNGAVTLTEAFDFLVKTVSEDTSKKQRPWLNDSFVAQAVLSRVQIARQLPTEEPAVVPRVKDTARPDVASVKTSVKPEASPANSTSNSLPIRPKVNEPVIEKTKTEPLPVNSIRTPEAPPKPPAESAAGATGPVTPIRRASPSPPVTGPVSDTGAGRDGRAGSGKLELAVAGLPAPPRPSPAPPSVGRVSTAPSRNPTDTGVASIPVAQPGAAPSPLTLQLEAAIAAGSLVEPRNASAWDIYQRLAQTEGAASDAARLKPRLVEALIKSGRAIVVGDVRSDNISDKVDDFKRAGQIFARAKSLAPENTEIAALEKLSAAQALIALQFFDEAEKALTQAQTSKSAAIENALGIVYRGKLDDFRAERAFKRAIEIAADWAAPHYNLALLYQGQKNEAALDELKLAARFDSTNPVILVAVGDELFNRQKWLEAAEAYRKAVSARPDDDTLHTKLGHALYSQGLRDEANREYQKATDLRKKKP
jgi:tetratricopeptide (TPR) repeat protein